MCAVFAPLLTHGYSCAPRIDRRASCKMAAISGPQQKLSFNSTEMLDRVACMDDAVQRKAILFGRIRCHEHFSLAMRRHLAIMCGQLGKEQTERFHLQYGNVEVYSALGWNSS
jgi:hypothetical protein